MAIMKGAVQWVRHQCSRTPTFGVCSVYFQVVELGEIAALSFGDVATQIRSFLNNHPKRDQNAPLIFRSATVANSPTSRCRIQGKNL